MCTTFHADPRGHMICDRCLTEPKQVLSYTLTMKGLQLANNIQHNDSKI